MAAAHRSVRPRLWSPLHALVRNCHALLLTGSVRAAASHRVSPRRRALLLSPSEERGAEITAEELILRVQALGQPQRWAVLLCRGGHFAGAVFDQVRAKFPLPRLGRADGKALRAAAGRGRADRASCPVPRRRLWRTKPSTGTWSGPSKVAGRARTMAMAAKQSRPGPPSAGITRPHSRQR